MLRTPAPFIGALGVPEEFGAIESMPVISTFFGIIVRMFYREHGVPHFHAEYQGQQATFTLDGEPLAGTLRSRTARRLLKEWAIANRIELEANWTKAKVGERLDRIPPLE